MEFTSKTILLLLLIVAAAGVILWFGIRKQDSQVCTPVLSIDESKAMIDSLDKQTSHFASTTVELMGRSTEGGVQTTFSDGNSKKIVEQRFYGETGRSYMRFYFDGNKLFSIVKLNLMYAVPLSVDNDGTVSSTEERDYYMDASGEVCNLDINSVTQPVDQETQNMIKEYVAGIQ